LIFGLDSVISQPRLGLPRCGTSQGRDCQYRDPGTVPGSCRSRLPRNPCKEDIAPHRLSLVYYPRRGRTYLHIGRYDTTYSTKTSRRRSPRPSRPHGRRPYDHRVSALTRYIPYDHRVSALTRHIPYDHRVSALTRHIPYDHRVSALTRYIPPPRQGGFSFDK
jgi:hypothetical protein